MNEGWRRLKEEEREREERKEKSRTRRKMTSTCGVRAQGSPNQGESGEE